MRKKHLQRHPVITNLPLTRQIEENCKGNSPRQFQLRWSSLLRESVGGASTAGKKAKTKRSPFGLLLFLAPPAGLEPATP